MEVDTETHSQIEFGEISTLKISIMVLISEIREPCRRREGKVLIASGDEGHQDNIDHQVI